jgi:hypothetical protein
LVYQGWSDFVCISLHLVSWICSCFCLLCPFSWFLVCGMINMKSVSKKQTRYIQTYLAQYLKDVWPAVAEKTKVDWSLANANYYCKWQEMKFDCLYVNRYWS